MDDSTFNLTAMLTDPQIRGVADTTRKVRRLGNFRSKPILGGVFAGGAYHLCSVAWTTTGLHEVEFMVIDEPSSFTIGRGATKTQALEAARAALRTQWQRETWAMLFARIAADRAREEAAIEASLARQKREAQDSEPRPPSISRRRRAIFEKSSGRCHYCACELHLDGRWHVEHMIPRALGGQSVSDNLVAACAPCNHKKLDKTDHEFIAAQGAKR